MVLSIGSVDAVRVFSDMECCHKLVNSIDEYAHLVQSEKMKGYRLINNSYVLNSAIERLILQKRLTYILCDGNLLFLEDEIEYYNLVFFVHPESKFEVPNMDKPVVVRILNKNGRDSETFALCTDKVDKRGFIFQKSYINVQCDPNEMLIRLNDIAPKAESYVDRFGIEIIRPDAELLQDIRRMQYEIDSVPFYDIEYRTDEEMKTAAETGYLLAAVNKNSGELCGANYSVVNGRYVTGWIAVRDQYRDVPGISVCLHKRAAQRDAANNSIKKTWIAKDNRESLEYHERIGFHHNGEEMNLWMLEP